MAVIHVLTGGSGSGKSEYAENLAKTYGDLPRFYIATMQVWDEEGRKRVERHHLMRAGKGFETIECFTDLEHLILPQSKQSQNCVVLLECMSNLVLNEYYRVGADTPETVMRGINRLQKSCRHLMIVTNEIFSDGKEYDRETMEYIKLLGVVNRRLSEAAGTVTEVVYGMPVKIK